LFGNIIEEGEIRLSEIGQIVLAGWARLTEHFRNIELDEFVVMPNHLHGIIVIAREPTRRGEAIAAADESRVASLLVTAPRPRGTHPRSLNSIVQNFKAVTTRRIHQIPTFGGRRVWQRNYYEHIIRDENELRRIRDYISNNPLQWNMDDENPIRP
jgi:REP element-mobilizing transposase RayT